MNAGDAYEMTMIRVYLNLLPIDDELRKATLGRAQRMSRMDRRAFLDELAKYRDEQRREAS